MANSTHSAAQVYRKFLWIGSWGDVSPKPSYLYSNKKWIEDLGGELPTHRKWRGAGAVVRRYIDSAGKRRVTGGPLLKNTQSNPLQHPKSMTKLQVQLHTRTHTHTHPLHAFWCLRSYPRAFGRALARLAAKHCHPVASPLARATRASAPRALFKSMPGEDLWEDANLESVVSYLKRSKHLECRPAAIECQLLCGIVQFQSYKPLRCAHSVLLPCVTGQHEQCWQARHRHQPLNLACEWRMPSARRAQTACDRQLALAG